MASLAILWHSRAALVGVVWSDEEGEPTVSALSPGHCGAGCFAGHRPDGIRLEDERPQVAEFCIPDPAQAQHWNAPVPRHGEAWNPLSHGAADLAMDMS